MKRSLIALAFAASSIVALTGIVVAKDEAAKDVLPPGSVSRAEGLEAWKRIEAVVTHPRCANCHVDAKAIPMWTPAGESKSRVHGMNIHGGESRIGAETIPCSTCHMTSTLPNDPAPAPLRAGIDWQLAPVEFLWFGKSGAEICAQLKDPKRNGGRDAVGLLEHLAARCIAEWLHPAGVGARGRPHHAAGHLRGSRQGHGAVGSRRAALSELTPSFMSFIRSRF